MLYVNNDLIKYIIVGVVSFSMGVLTCILFNKLDSKPTSKNEEARIVQVTDKEMENGYIYTGGLKNSLRYGTGRMVTPKGTIYEGNWRGNQIVEGTMITRKYEYEGEFKNLSPNGYGTMKYVDGSFYRGMWNVGAKSGIGLFVDSIGKKSFGLWKNGVIDKKTMSTYKDNKSFGIDISHYNRVINWGNMALYAKKGGLVHTNVPKKDFTYLPVDYVYVKATEGATIRDNKYHTNMKNAKKYHKQRGSYHFMHLTSSSVKDQVENFLDFIVYEKGDLPPVLDIEVTKEAKEIGAPETRKRVLEWLYLVEKKMGVRPIIYTFANFKKDYLNSQEFAAYDFWIAHHKNSEPDYKEYVFWQFTDKGILYGNGNGGFDVNVRNLN